jgi:hypothetical protein
LPGLEEKGEGVQVISGWQDRVRLLLWRVLLPGLVAGLLWAWLVLFD